MKYRHMLLFFSLSVMFIKMASANTPDMHSLPEQSPGPSLSLEDAYTLALANNENIQVSYIDVKQSGLLTKEAVSEYLPRVTTNASVSYPKEEISFDDSIIVADPRIGANITLTQPILDGQKIIVFLARDTQSRLANEEYIRSIKDTLFNIATVYYNLQKAQELLTIQKENVKLSLEQLDIAHKRYDAGEVLKTDLLRAEVDESRAKRSLIATQNNLSQIQVQLSQLIGLNTTVCQAEDKPVSHTALLSVYHDFDELLNAAFEKRNDLKTLSIQKEIAAWNLRRIIAGYFPSANLEFDQSWIDPESFAQRNNFWTLALKFEMPIFEGNRKKIELQRVHNRIEQITLKEERLKKDIHIALSDAWYQYHTAQANLQAYQKEHELAQEHYEVTKKQYESGQATSLDLTDAFTNLVSARINYSNQRYDCEFSILKVLYTAGLFAENYIVNAEITNEIAKAEN